MLSSFSTHSLTGVSMTRVSYPSDNVTNASLIISLLHMEQGWRS